MAIALVLTCTHALLTPLIGIAFLGLVPAIHGTRDISTSLYSDDINAELTATDRACVMLIVFITHHHRLLW